MTVSAELVAARAGVSAATVSRALRNVAGVAPVTRKRVQEAAAELGYVPSAAASRLASGRTRTVALATPSLSTWFFGQVIGAATEVLREHGYDVLLYEIADAEQRARFFRARQLVGRSDGILVLTLALSDAEQEALRAQGQKVVILGGAGAPPTVRVDDEEAGRAATRHLLNLGHDRIAFIGIALTRDSTLDDAPSEGRRRGYQNALREAEIAPDPDLVSSGPNTVDGGVEAMTSLLAARHPATAAFVASDEMAFGALLALRRAGVEVPTRFSVVGFDNHDLAAVLELTTIDQDVRRQGRHAAYTLVAALDGRGLEPTTVATRLVIRGTTAPPALLRRTPAPPNDAAHRKDP